MDGGCADLLAEKIQGLILPHQCFIEATKRFQLGLLGGIGVIYIVFVNNILCGVL
jgi:hypothetical protein